MRRPDRHRSLSRSEPGHPKFSTRRGRVAWPVFNRDPAPDRPGPRARRGPGPQGGGEPPMRHYEVMVILDAGLEEDAIRVVLDRTTQLFTAGGATVGKVDRWGKRRFA